MTAVGASTFSRTEHFPNRTVANHTNFRTEIFLLLFNSAVWYGKKFGSLKSWCVYCIQYHLICLVFCGKKAQNFTCMQVFLIWVFQSQIIKHGKTLFTMIPCVSTKLNYQAIKILAYRKPKAFTTSDAFHTLSVSIFQFKILIVNARMNSLKRCCTKVSKNAFKRSKIKISTNLRFKTRCT